MKKNLSAIIFLFLFLHSNTGHSQTPVLVKDIYAGTTSSTSSLYGIMYNGNYIFTAENAANGRELWITNGITAGTTLIKDIYPGSTSSAPSYFMLFNGIVYFTADDGTHGRELWKTDGTAAGTSLVKDIMTGTSSGFEQWCCGGFQFSKVWEHNGSFFFIANTVATSSNDNIELWKSDGTTAGTVMVKDIYPGNNGSIPEYFTEFNNTLYFTADDGTHGRELWKSDGTSAGTSLVKDIMTGTSSGFEQWCCGGFQFSKVWEHNGSFFFIANTIATSSYDNIELWKSDGTTAGTVMVKDIYPGNNGSIPEYFTEFNNTLYFTADDGTHGRELWKSDGIGAGTALVKDIMTGTSSGFEQWCCGGFQFSKVWEHNGSFFFIANTIATSSYDNIELWKSDGTTAGTVMVKDIYPGNFGSIPEYFTEFNNTLYFTADDGTHGRELWKSDGTSGGTALVKDIMTGTSSGFEQYCCGGFQFSKVWEHSGSFFFIANDYLSSSSDNIELWKSDGTTAGTVRVKDINPGNTGSIPEYFYPFGNQLFFSADDGTTGRELWKTDGTAGGTALVKDIMTGSGNGIDYSFYKITEYGSSFYFKAYQQGTSDDEIWKTDGTTAGTIRVMDIYAGTSGSYANSFIQLPNDYLIFLATDATHGEELWSMYLPGFTGIDEAVSKNFSVYPNPVSTGRLMIRCGDATDELNIQLFDLSGRELFFQKINSVAADAEIPLQLPVLASGVYFLQLSDGKTFSRTCKIDVSAEE